MVDMSIPRIKLWTRKQKSTLQFLAVAIVFFTFVVKEDYETVDREALAGMNHASELYRLARDTSPNGADYVQYEKARKLGLRQGSAEALAAGGAIDIADSAARDLAVRTELLIDGLIRFGHAIERGEDEAGIETSRIFRPDDHFSKALEKIKTDLLCLSSAREFANKQPSQRNVDELWVRMDNLYKEGEEFRAQAFDVGEHMIKDLSDESDDLESDEKGYHHDATVLYCIGTALGAFASLFANQDIESTD